MRKILNLGGWEAFLSELNSNWTDFKGPLPKKFPVIVSETIQSNGPNNQTATCKYLYSEDVADMVDPPSKAETTTQYILSELRTVCPEIDDYAAFISGNIQAAINEEIAKTIRLNRLEK